MNKKGINIPFLLGFSIIPIFCVLLDLFLGPVLFGNSVDPSTISPYQKNFDMSIINQLSYISVGASMVVCFFAISTLINMKNKRVPHGMCGENMQTFATALDFIVFLIYFIALVSGHGVTGFDNWYKILKSVLEHFCTPVLMIIFYFISIRNVVSCKSYAQKYGGFTLIFIAVYLAYIILRVVMLAEFDPRYSSMKHGVLPPSTGPDGVFAPFPYEGVDPYTHSPALWIPAIIAIFVGTYALCNLFNFLGNLSKRSLIKRFNLEDEFEMYPDGKPVKKIKTEKINY